MAELKRPEDAFVFISWDGLSNPFPNEPQPGWDLGGNDLAAAKRCIEHFSQQFQSAFLVPDAAADNREPSTKPELDWNRRLQRLRQLPSLPREAHVNESNWPKLRQIQASQPSHWTWQQLANTFPWQCPLRPVKVFLNKQFTRIFSAVGPDLCLFLTKENLSGDNPIHAAQLVHEFGHLDHGNSVGWQKFQNCSRLEVESYAIQAELKFLRQLCTDLGMAWESSWMRQQWNNSYAQMAPEISPQEAADYLSILEQTDPVAPK
jgi:hypothetical protein